jgi:predicted ATPase
VVTYNGFVYLEINVSDSDRKREFVVTQLEIQLELATDGRRFKKHYASDCDLNTAMHLLEDFLSEDKRHIDHILKMQADTFFVPGEEGFGYIDIKEFRQRRNNVCKYRDMRDNESFEREDSYNTEKPSKIRSFTVNDSGPIQFAQMLDIPLKTQWIFITGENGSGKSSFLKAIGTALGYRALSREEMNANPEFHVDAQLGSEFRNSNQNFQRYKNEGTKFRRPRVMGLCMYGPFRIYNSRKLSQAKFLQLYNKSGGFSSLFSDNAPLLDIDKQLDIWKKDRKAQHMLEKRQYHIKNVLTSVVPNLYNIEFHLGEEKKPIAYYTRKDDSSQAFPTKWEHLSSGTKSVFCLIVDILLRLYDQQPQVSDPGELRGMVLIDEIDLHLHPKGQKDLVSNLTYVFPHVQFIVTTHSPIPLLGASRDSRIYVMRNNNGEISMERMDDKVMFSRILPNAIFSSPIFGFEDLIADSKPNDEIPFLEDDFREVKKTEQLNQEIAEFLTNAKQKELYNLFNLGA